MKQPVPIEYDKYYHIYNRGINGENLFRENFNFIRFIIQTPLGLSDTNGFKGKRNIKPVGVRSSRRCLKNKRKNHETTSTNRIRQVLPHL